jgi:hypothetical protein
VRRPAAIYFIQCNGPKGPIKIGQAVDPNRRLSELRIGCPYPMSMLVTFQPEDADLEERRLHLVFRHLRIHGEWFEFATELLAFVRTVPSDAKLASARIMELVGLNPATVRRRLASR